jgi:DNA-binding NarL/FixJ family response regulator
MRKTTGVFLLAENRLLREALIRLLSKKRELRVLGASAYSAEVHREILDVQPHILLLDSNGLSPSQAALRADLLGTNRSLRIVMVDMDPDESTFLKAVRAGAVGYVLKDASASDVASAICAVAGGEAVCPRSLSITLFRTIAQQATSAVCLTADLGLSRRELQLVDLLRERLTNKEIASRLNLSEQTVKNHVHHILRKAGVPNRRSIVERIEGPPPVF